jgi:hypothetical protein
MKHNNLKALILMVIVSLAAIIPAQACSILSFLPPTLPKGDIELVFNNFTPPKKGPPTFKIEDAPIPGPVPEAVPEPGTMALMGIGALLLAGAAHRNRKNQLK